LSKRRKPEPAEVVEMANAAGALVVLEVVIAEADSVEADLDLVVSEEEIVEMEVTGVVIALVANARIAELYLNREA
jgi:hypothetical protein